MLPWSYSSIMETLYDNIQTEDFTLDLWSSLWQSIREFSKDSMNLESRATGVITSGGDSSGGTLVGYKQKIPSPVTNSSPPPNTPILICNLRQNLYIPNHENHETSEKKNPVN